MTNKDVYFMSIAHQVAWASKCIRAKYGTVIVSKDGRIVSTGYNGKPRGCKNDNVCYRDGLPANASKPNCCLHSEANALLFSSPIERMGGTMYVSGVPCTDCALLIANSGIARVVYFYGPNLINGHMGNFDQEFADKYGFSVVFEPYRKEE